MKFLELYDELSLGSLGSLQGAFELIPPTLGGNQIRDRLGAFFILSRRDSHRKIGFYSFSSTR